MADTIAVAELAKKMAVQGREIIKKLWALGMMEANINKDIDLDTATLIATEFGYQIESTAFREDELLTSSDAPAENPEDLLPRAPVVTIMGHVDHGKTSLLDAIRKANVAAGEAGGITQHIGAYKVSGERGDVVFLDTPGHEAFTAMRARGAQMTDIVVLVVAADDGPMPQTIEAINHAKEAQVPIVVAVNKIDKPGANPDMMRTKLSEYDLVPEEWGGTTIYVNVSAKTKEGVDKLLEMLTLQAELLELRANPNKAAKGHVVEARLDRARGAISTILVEEGTLRLGDLLVAGEYTGKIRAMLGDKGQAVTDAGPSTPVEVLGLDGVPDAGEIFNVVTDEKAAKALAEHRHDARRKKELAGSGRVSLENILDKIKSGEVKEVKVVLKADVQGSVEAVANALTKLSTDNVGVNVISTGVGGITESDVSLAKASSAVVIGLQRPPGGQGPAAGGAGERRHQAVPGHLRRHRRREEGDGRHAGADHAREAPRQGGGAADLQHPEGGDDRRQLRHRREDHAQGAAAPRSRFGRHLHGQGRLAAAVQGRRLRGRAGLRVWSFDRGLRRPQGRRRDRGVRGRIRGADAREPGRRRQAFLDGYAS